MTRVNLGGRKKNDRAIMTGEIRFGIVLGDASWFARSFVGIELVTGLVDRVS